MTARRKAKSELDKKYERLAAHTAVVLVGTQGGMNLGSVARVMMNFGFSRLRLVRPEVEVIGVEARSMAMDAKPLLQNAELFDRLEDAIADCDHVIGSTRRTGRKRRAELSAADMAQLLMSIDPERGVAIVFGPESFGLSTEDLQKCNAIVTIETRADFNSFNLAQAALLMFYEIHRSFEDSSPARMKNLEHIEKLMSHTETLLRHAGLVTGKDEDQVMTRLHKMALRAAPTYRESRLLHSLLGKLDNIIEPRKIK